MESCLYEGHVRHRRLAPHLHAFRYRVLLAYIDLEEAPALATRGLLSRGYFGPATYRREDHFGDAGESLSESVRRRAAEETGRQPGGPMRMRTALRQWGYYFSPLNLCFCFDPSGQRVETIVAEVTNTPWGEKRIYVLGCHNRTHDERLRFAHGKDFHVSPFLPMGLAYRWRLSSPDEKLGVHIEVQREGRRAFDASLQLRRRAWSRVSLWRALVRNPFTTGRITFGIYWEAFRLWLKKTPYFPHPDHTSSGAPCERPATA